MVSPRLGEVRYIQHFAALAVPIESTEFDSDRSPSLPKVGSLLMAGGESAIAGNYTCRAAERSLHTLGEQGARAE